MVRLRRAGATPPDRSGGPELPDDSVRAAPGFAALVEGLGSTRLRSVLDLGPASADNLRFCCRYARRVRVADLLKARATEGSPLEALGPPLGHPEQPYGLVLAWNVLDSVSAEQRPPLVEALASLTRAGARLHVLIDMSDAPFVHPVRFTVEGDGRLRERVRGPLEPAPGRMLPSEVEALLNPFRVERAFVLRGGIREYLAVRR